MEFIVAPLLHIHPDEVQEYFQTLHVHDTLKYRLSDVDNPVWGDMAEVISRMGETMYLVLDAKTDRILAEFTLENFTGRTCQSHFSTHPEIDTKTRIKLGRQAVEHTLRVVNPDTGEPFLHAMWGLTPLKNRVACIFAMKLGYKKVGVMKSAMMYFGEPTDCMVSQVTLESF